MNKSKKILVLLLTLIMTFSFVVPCFATDESVTSLTWNVEIKSGQLFPDEPKDYKNYTFTFSINLPSTSYPVLVTTYDYVGTGDYVNNKSYLQLYILDTKNNTFSLNTISFFTHYSFEGYSTYFGRHKSGESDMTYASSQPVCLQSGEAYVNTLSSNIPIFNIATKDSPIPTYNDIISGSVSSVNGLNPWDNSNHYHYNSTYSSSVVSPDIRYAYMYHQKEVKYQNGDVTPEDYGFYCLFRTDTDIINDYYTEVWVEGPYLYQGNLTTRKVCVGVYKTSELAKSLDMQYSSSSGSGMDTEHYGSCYELKISWNDTLSPYFDFDYFKNNGGGKVFLRNHVKRSDTDVYVSMYSWFNINPNDIKDIDGGSVTSRPVIHNSVGSDLNESGVADVSGSTSSPNAYDYDFIAGNTVEPSKNIVNDGAMPEDSHQYDSDYISTSGGTYLPDVNNIDGFADYVSTGFGLLGSRGLIACLKSILTLLPEEIFVYLTWFVCIGIALALLCLLFKK